MAAPDQARWRQIAAVFDRVLDGPVDERQDFVEEACDGDPELRAEVEALLAAADVSAPRIPTAALAEAFAGDPPARPGEILGPYILRREIGRGGMGVVFEAVDTRIDRTVAIKILHAQLGASAGAGFGAKRSSERALREARAASALDHPNLCTLYDLGETPAGQPFLVMAFYSGETLGEKLARGPVPCDRARNLLRQIAAGLGRAHEAGIVHRDLKPANVLITDRGELKILDFGIAKIHREVSLTRTGESPGTPAYMAPEQARGEEVDGRADLWAVGVVLFEMITGQRPFAADHPQVALHQILNGDNGFLDLLPENCPADLRRVLVKTLARDPRKRYRSADELLGDLKNEGGKSANQQSGHRRGRRGLRLLVTLGLMGLVFASIWFLLQPWGTQQLKNRDGETRPWPVDRAEFEAPGRQVLTSARSGRTRVAVLPFRNLRREQDLDWLRTGIAELLVADLSQSAELDLVSTTQTARAFSTSTGETVGTAEPEAERLTDWVRQEGIGALVRGGFARAGETLRIVLSVEDAGDGRVLLSRRVEGAGEEQLFVLVDELTAAIRKGFEVTTPPGAGNVARVTTASLDAWRLYSEGVDLHHRGKRAEALVLLEKAVEVDPTFALAWVSLARLHKNLGDLDQAHRCSARAVELAERLPLSSRHEIVAAHYGTRWSTFAIAIEAYQQAIRHNPHRETPRNNLAKIYTDLERYEEAIGEYTALIAMGTNFPGTTTALANAHAGLGQFETAHRLLLDLVRTHPQNWSVHMQLGWLLTEWGRFEEALGHFERAETLRPGEPFLHYARWRAYVLLESWTAAEMSATALLDSGKSWATWRGAVSLAKVRIYQGRQTEALALFDRAIGSRRPGDGFTALARCWKAALLRSRGEPALALEETRRARQEGRGDWPELEGIFEAALALQDLGRSAEADELLGQLEARADTNPNQVEKRQALHLGGLLALSRGQNDPAIDLLSQAEALLPPRGVEFHWFVYPRHVAIWTALGRAYHATGNRDPARRWLEQAVSSGAEHLESPLVFLQSRSLLDQLTSSGQQVAPRSTLNRHRFVRRARVWVRSLAGA